MDGGDRGLGSSPVLIYNGGVEAGVGVKEGWKAVREGGTEVSKTRGRRGRQEGENEIEPGDLKSSEVVEGSDGGGTGTADIVHCFWTPTPVESATEIIFLTITPSGAFNLGRTKEVTVLT
jgi:hypothetical protein